MYLITKDYERAIQTSELNAITSFAVNGRAVADSIRQLVEGSVQREMYASLMQRFDLDAEFTSTDAFALATVYKGNNRVYLDATTYSATSTYALNALTLYSGNVYICSTAITVAEAFTLAHWTLLGAQYDLFYLSTPYPAFKQDTYYYKDDCVFWKDKIYTAQRDSSIEDQQSALQAPSIESINYGNVTPDDRVNGRAMWGTGVSFVGAAGMLPTNPLKTAWSNVTVYVTGNTASYLGVNYIATGGSTNVVPGTNVAKWLPVTWMKADNRNQHFIKIILDCVIYDLCKRIAPGNVPEARHNAWVKAQQDIKAFARGDLNAQLPIIQPKQGNRIAYGGNPKQDNSW